MATVVLKDIKRDDIEQGDYIVLGESLEVMQIIYIGGIGYGALDIEDGKVYNAGKETIDELVRLYDIYRVIDSDNIEIREL